MPPNITHSRSLLNYRLSFASPSHGYKGNRYTARYPGACKKHRGGGYKGRVDDCEKGRGWAPIVLLYITGMANNLVFSFQKKKSRL